MIVNQLSRFAVPLFFVLTGYFWGLKVESTGNYWLHSSAIIRTSIIVWFGWSLVYLLPYNLGSLPEYGVNGPILLWKSNIALFSSTVWNILEGTKVHLWFLISLSMGIAICGVFAHFKAFKLLTVIAIVLYIIGVFAASYRATEVGISLPVNTRNGPFISTLMLVSGYWLSRLKPTSSAFIPGLLLTLFGFWLHYTEALWLWQKHQTWFLHDYLFGTYFSAIGIFLIALSSPSMKSLKGLTWIGEHSLGIYAVHFIFVDNLFFIDRRLNSPLWEISYVLIVFLLSVITCYVLSKHTCTKWLVTNKGHKKA